MAYIKLHNVSLEYPIFDAQTRSIRNNILHNVGGKISKGLKTAASVKALNNITLDINDGDNLAVIGHNGAGKTSLLRVISDIYQPSKGTIEVNGKVSALTNIQLGMEPEATGYENIIMRGIFMGMTFKEIKSKMDEIIEFSELGEYINLPMRTYSTGMALRLSFAVSTSFTPQILVLDEMIGAGDKSFLKKATERTKQIMKKAKILILSSHNNEILKEFCDKAILMKEGSIIAQGSVNEIIQKHENIQDL